MSIGTISSAPSIIPPVSAGAGAPAHPASDRVEVVAYKSLNTQINPALARFNTLASRLELPPYLKEIGKMPRLSLHAFLLLHLVLGLKPLLSGLSSEKAAEMQFDLIKIFQRDGFSKTNHEKIQRALMLAKHTGKAPKPVQDLGFVLSMPEFSAITARDGGSFSRASGVCGSDW